MKERFPLTGMMDHDHAVPLGSERDEEVVDREPRIHVVGIEPEAPCQCVEHDHVGAKVLSSAQQRPLAHSFRQVGEVLTLLRCQHFEGGVGAITKGLLLKNPDYTH